MSSAVRLTCKNCNQTGYLKDFHDCAYADCKLQMTKPPAILGPVRHHPECTCARCLEEDAVNLEKSFKRFMDVVKDPVPIPVQQKIRVMVREVAVASSCEDGPEALYVEVPMVICGSIYPRGKKK